MIIHFELPFKIFDSKEKHGIVTSLRHPRRTERDEIEARLECSRFSMMYRHTSVTEHLESPFSKIDRFETGHSRGRRGGERG